MSGAKRVDVDALPIIVTMPTQISTSSGKDFNFDITINRCDDGFRNTIKFTNVSGVNALGTTPNGFTCADANDTDTFSINSNRQEMIETKYSDVVFASALTMDDTEIKTTRKWKDTKGRAADIDRIDVLSDEIPEFRYQQLAEALFNDETKEVPSITANQLRGEAQLFAC